jgi:hypothetical protein
MNTVLELKNFRVFDEKDGGLFHLFPITVLTGCNSSGKSSVTKALLLLRDFFSDIRTNKVDDCKLNFGNKVAKLGRYDLVRNCNSSPKSKMCFSYIVRGKQINDLFLIEMYFATRGNDKTNSGWVDRIIVKKGRKERVLLDVDYSKEGNVVIRKIDLNVIKEDFLHHVYYDLLQSQETMTMPAESPSRNDELEAINQKNLEILDHIIAALKKHTTEEQFTRIVDNIELGNCGSVYESEYNMPIYLSSNEHNVIFSFPIFDALKNVEKWHVRSAILSMIDSCDRRCGDGSKYEFPFKNALDADKASEVTALLAGYTKAMPEGEAKKPADTTYFTDISVYVGEVPSFRFYLAGNYTKADFTFKVGARTVEVTEGTDSYGKYLEVTMYAYMMLDDVTFTVKGTDVSGTYNLYSYLDYAKNVVKDANLVAIVEGLMKYSVSAKAYRSAVIGK